MELNITLTQLQAATKQQILDKLDTWLSNRTKRQLIGLILTVANDMGDKVELPDAPIITYQPDGQIASHLNAVRDTLGVKLGGKRITWTYYPTGEVDTITAVQFDANDAVGKRRTIKHYTDGSQPTVTEG